MAWDKGFNFRATAGYVTDGPNETYVIGDAYPVTRNSVTFGWLDSIGSQTRDRLSSGDVRLAGINYAVNTPAVKRFQVDLPATGDYIITLAMGDATFSHSYASIEFLDNTTSLATLTGIVLSSAGYFCDAAGTVHTSQANWIANEVTITKTFATTILIIKLGSVDAQSDVSPIAHLFVSQVAAGAAGNPHYAYQQQ